MERYKALEQLLTELEDFLKILDQENLSSTAVVRKSGLAELLRLYTKSSSSDEEYIYMNKVTVNKQQDAESQDKVPEEQSPLTNGEPSQHSSAPQKSLPDLPPPKIIPEREQLSIPKIESPEGYYEEAEPYDMSLNGHSGRFPPTGVPRWVRVPEGVIYATITLGTARPQSWNAVESVPAAWLSETGSCPERGHCSPPVLLPGPACRVSGETYPAFHRPLPVASESMAEGPRVLHGHPALCS